MTARLGTTIFSVRSPNLLPGAQPNDGKFGASPGGAGPNRLPRGAHLSKGPKAWPTLELNPVPPLFRAGVRTIRLVGWQSGPPRPLNVIIRPLCDEAPLGLRGVDGARRATPRELAIVYLRGRAAREEALGADARAWPPSKAQLDMSSKCASGRLDGMGAHSPKSFRKMR